MDSGLCGLLNACHRVIIYRHTDATDSPTFSLALMLPISDVPCANRRNSRDVSETDVCFPNNKATEVHVLRQTAT